MMLNLSASIAVSGGFVQLKLQQVVKKMSAPCKTLSETVQSLFTLLLTFCASTDSLDVISIYYCFCCPRSEQAKKTGSFSVLTGR